MRKSSLILLLAMAFVLTTVVAGFSASVTEPCYECEKGWTYGLKIAFGSGNFDSATDQTGNTPTDDCSGYFDYEQGSQGYKDHCSTCDDECCVYGGYCPTQDVNGVVLRVCDCPDYDEWASADSYSIKIEIIDAPGVYFSDRNVSINKKMEDPDNYPGNSSGDDLYGACSMEYPCGDTSEGYIYVSSHPKNTGETAFCAGPCDDATPYALAYEPLNAGEVLYDLNVRNCDADYDDWTPEPCDFDDVDYATAIIASCSATFMDPGMPDILIDIPTLVYDTSVAALGQQVIIRVSILGNPEGADVCGEDCNLLCFCEVNLGTFTDCPCSSNCGWCLPYLPAVNGSWWSGIALTNADTYNDVNATLTFYSGLETVVVYVPLAKGSVETIALSNIPELAPFADKTIYAAVRGADNALVIIGNDTQSYGYLGKEVHGNNRFPCRTCSFGDER